MTRGNTQGHPTARRGLAPWLALDALLVGANVILLIVGVAVSGASFVQPANIRVMLVSCAVSGLLAIAQTIILIVREIDLAIGATLVVAPLLAVYTADQLVYATTGQGLLIGLTGKLVGGWWLIVGLTVVYAILIGGVMGFVVAFLKVPSFVVTIGLSFVMIGTGYVLSQGTPIFFDGVDGSEFIGNAFIADLIPWSAVCFVAVALVVSFFMNMTKVGPRLYATGGNPRSAALTGMNVRRWRVLAFAASGVIIGVAGILNMSRMQGIDIGQSANFALQSIVIAILGGVGVRGGEGRVSAVVLATFAFSLLAQILSSLSLNFYAQMAISGLVVLVFTSVSKQADSRRLRLMRRIEA